MAGVVPIEGGEWRGEDVGRRKGCEWEDRADLEGVCVWTTARGGGVGGGGGVKVDWEKRVGRSAVAKEEEVVESAAGESKEVESAS